MGVSISLKGYQDVCADRNMLLNKLNKYKELEKRGQLIIIPFYEGETAYVIRKFDDFSGEITECEFIGLDYHHVSGISLSFAGKGGIKEVKLENCTELAFHTQSDAEKALSDLKNTK